MDQPPPFTVDVVWVESPAEIEKIRQQYGVNTDLGRFRPQRAEGFSVLVRADGALVCRIWVPRPRNVDDDRTTALGHELAHCLLGNYHQ